MITDVRKTLPKGMNAEDMKEDGSRWVMMHCYGNPFEQATVVKIFAAWNVLKWWLINKTSSSLYDGVPKISNDGGPRYMLLFADGFWRYASFGGLNGPPCASCFAKGIEAPNGMSAYLLDVLEGTIANRVRHEEEVKRLGDEIANLKETIAQAMKAPERKDETWQHSKK